MEDLGSLKEYVYAWVPTTGDSDLTQIGASFNLLSIQRSPGNFGRRQWQPTLVLLPGKSHGQRSLAGYRAWSCQSRAWQRLSNNTLTKDLWAVLAQNPEHSWSDDLSTESEKTTHTKARLWNVGDPETALRNVMNLKRTTKHKENEEAKAVKRENLIQQLSQKEAKHAECESH